MNDFVLDNLGGVALKNLDLHGLVSDNQVAHRVLLIVLGLVLLLLSLLLGGLLLLRLLLRLLLCLLLQLMLLSLLLLLLGLLLCLLLSSLLLLLLLNQGVLVCLLNNNQLLLLLRLLLLGLTLLTLRLRLALSGTLILLEMLPLMQHEMVLLEESLSAFANVCSHGTSSVRVATIVQQKTMLSSESFATVSAVVGFGLRLRDHNGLLVLDLLQLLDRLLNNLNLLLMGLSLDLLLLMLHLDLLLWRALRLQRLLYHLTGGGDNLYLVNGWEQMSRNGSRKGAKVRHQALITGVQAQMEGKCFSTVEGTATFSARILRARGGFG